MSEASVSVLMFVLGIVVGMIMRPSLDAAYETVTGGEEGIPFVPFI